MDGESLKPVLLGNNESTERVEANNGTQFLVEYFGEGNPCFGGMGFIHGEELQHMNHYVLVGVVEEARLHACGHLSFVIVSLWHVSFSACELH